MTKNSRLCEMAAGGEMLPRKVRELLNCQMQVLQKEAKLVAEKKNCSGGCVPRGSPVMDGAS